MEKTFTRIRSTKDIIISTTLAIAGFVLVALPTSVSVNLIGFFMIFAGIIMLLFCKTGYKDAETGTKYCKTECFFSQSKRPDIESKLGGNPQEAKVICTEKDNGNGLRLDIYKNKKSGNAYVQLFEYVPYKYVPCTKVYECNTDTLTYLTGR